MISPLGGYWSYWCEVELVVQACNWLTRVHQFISQRRRRRYRYPRVNASMLHFLLAGTRNERRHFSQLGAPPSQLVDTPAMMSEPLIREGVATSTRVSRRYDEAARPWRAGRHVPRGSPAFPPIATLHSNCFTLSHDVSPRRRSPNDA